MTGVAGGWQMLCHPLFIDAQDVIPLVAGVYAKISFP